MSKLFNYLAGENDDFTTLWNDTDANDWVLVQEMECLMSMLVHYAIGEAKMFKLMALKTFYICLICKKYSEVNMLKLMQVGEQPQEQQTIKSLVK
jgi:hypothetical protein